MPKGPSTVPGDHLALTLNGHNRERLSARSITVGDRPEPTELDLPFDPEEPDRADDEQLELNPRRGNSTLVTADFTSDQIRAAIHAVLPESGPIDRERLVRSSAQQLGVARISEKFRSRLNKTIGAEVRYGRLQRSADWSQLWRPL